MVVPLAPRPAPPPPVVPLGALTFALVFGLTGCAGEVGVTRTLTPTAASRVDGAKLQPVAIVRDGERLNVPPGTRVEADRLVGPAGRGSFALRSTDEVEMHGRFGPGESIPGGGRVESSRSGVALVAGTLALVVSYAPTAYLGATSGQASDRVLFAPVVGPWLDVVHRSACVAPPSPIPLPVNPCIVETATRAALVTSGALQDLGALLVLVGLPASSHVVEGGDRGVAFVPSPGGGALFGRF
jgi:hypothetical protein